MSRHKENNHLSSQQRANDSILSTRTPQSNDFFTDSVLDASKIPTPSPKKYAFGASYKQRRALGNNRIKDAWKATADTGRGSGFGNESVSPRPPYLKPTTPPRSPTLPQLVECRPTPSPPPLQHPPEYISPKSEVSSPPRGLTDVYQRIADEEDLAEQEREMEEEEDEEEYTEEVMPDPYNETGREDIQPNGRLGEAPAFQRDSHGLIPNRFTLDGNKENLLEEVTSLSEASGLSFLKDITDQKLAAALTPHTIDRAKDRIRLERAINNDRPIGLYSQRPRNGLTTENLQRNGSAADHLVKKDSSSGSVTTERSEPPPNVPRVWGTRKKIGKEWLRVRREGSLDGIKSSPVPESSQVDWAAAAAEVALPSVEDSSTPKVQSSRVSTPASLRKQSSLDRIRQWELNDFTGQSLQVSNSPPVRIKTNVVDRNRNKEIEGLEKQAVTTSRLGEIRRQNSSEYLPRLSQSPSSGFKNKDDESMLPLDKSKGVKFAGDGEKIPGTPIVIYKSSSSTSNANTGDGERPEHNRKESLNHLQRLARATSNSPKTNPSPGNGSLIGSEDDLRKSNGQLDETSQLARMSDDSRISSKQVMDEEATPHGVKVSDTAKTPVVTGAWTDTILPDTIKTAKKQEERFRYAQTPRVNAGGWVDTPFPTQRHSSTLAPIPIEEVTEELTNENAQEQTKAELGNIAEPSTQLTVPKQAEMPTSALATLLERAKRRLVSQDITTAKDGNDTLNLGDATIESLEDLLTLDAADMTTLIRIGAEAEARDQLLGLSENDPMDEAELLERLGTKLERLRTNIHDARKGISKLEHQVTCPDSGQPLQPSMKNGPCDACGCPRTTSGLDAAPDTAPADSNMYLAIPIPRLFHRRRKDLGHWIPRPTRLGWITLIAWCWYISESTMCELYCHPLYADHYDWPSEREPEFPWALPTMLWRWSGIRKAGPALLGPLWMLLVAVVRIVGQAFGLTDGYVDNPYKLVGGSSPAGFETSGASENGAIDFSMMNDEYI
jgi:hypothetical protein